MKTNFEITQDREFLKHFWDSREIFKLSPEMVKKLSLSEDPYGVYGYGQWLYRVRPDGDESLKKAQECFKYASENGIADAKQMLSLMYYYGDYCNEDKDGIWEKNNILALIYNAQAQEAGSELAKMRQNTDLFWGNIVPADKEKAIREAEEAASESEAALLWMEQLGWYYEAEGRSDEAIKVYEKCIEGGLYYPLYDLAMIYYQRGNIGYFESLMEEGIEKGVPSCMLWGFENEEVWDELSQEQQDEIRQRLETNLNKGITLGDGLCAYVLAYYKTYGYMGFEQDIEGALKAAQTGTKYHSYQCCSLILDIMSDEDFESELPETMQLTEEEYALMALKALRYGDESKLEIIVGNIREFTMMGYEEEMMYWSRKLEEQQMDEEDSEEDGIEGPSAPIENIVKTEIIPTVLVIHPSGYTDFVEADVYPMSYREMAELIDAESLDAVHFSDSLTKITKECGLDKNVAMYVDRDGISKDLDDNAVASMLYGQGYEIRGAVIIALEDRRYDTHSFDTEEDIETVFEAIDELTGLLRRETDDTGQYDPWA